MDLTVLVVTWNTRDLVVQCVQSVLEHTQVPSMEVIVVDNASSDDTVDVLRRQFRDIQVIESGSNLGGPGGFNLGMKVAQGELVMLMQNDGYVCDDVIGRMVDYMREHSDVGMLGCELQFPDGRHQHTARRHMSIWHSAVERFWLYKFIPARWRASVLLDGYWPAQLASDVDWLAAIQMVRAEAVLHAGGFDEQFYGGGEESEWAARVARAGYRIRYVPSLGVVFHVGSASWSQVWSPSEQIEGWHRAGIHSYTMQHGRIRGIIYRLTDATGAIFRWAVYSVAYRLRSNDYHRQQAMYYRTLRNLYFTRGVKDSPGSRLESH